LLVVSIPVISMGGPMENTAYLRRQALFYLRLSQLCLDRPLANYLRLKAAEIHEKALRAEFEGDLDPDEHDWVQGDPWSRASASGR
jgi:hypothetical protein